MLLITLALSAYGIYTFSSSSGMAITILGGILVVSAILYFLHGKKWAESLVKLETPVLIFSLIAISLVSLSYGAFIFFENISAVYYGLASFSGFFFSSLLLFLESGLFKS